MEILQIARQLLSSSHHVVIVITIIIINNNISTVIIIIIVSVVEIQVNVRVHVNLLITVDGLVYK